MAQEKAKWDIPRLTMGAWDPHFSYQVVTANDTAVRGWDLRSSS
jgi:hypothetical protein